MKCSVLQARPGDGPALDQVDLDVVTVGCSMRDAAELAVALHRMAVAEIEQRALGVHRQVDDGARARRRAGPCCRRSSPGCSEEIASISGEVPIVPMKGS